MDKGEKKDKDERELRLLRTSICLWTLLTNL